MLTHRPIRSFVLRAGRVTAAQERALRELWPRYGLEFSGSELDFDAIFGRSAPRCLEIGFGTGELLGALAAANPGVDYLGVEVHRPGVGRLLLQAQQAGLENLRVICHDAVEVLTDGVADASLREVLVFFPDPWHKKRHHKRRLIEPQFVATLARKMQGQGVLRLATDWQPYAEQMLEVCNANPDFVSLSADRTYVARPEFRRPTRFEKRGERLGHRVWDLAYERRAR
jgi:tRNA (guanine-N7-)-methyltransferase